MAHQNIDQLEKQLAISLYGWSLKDASREVAQEYPLLRTIQSDVAYAFLQLVEPFSCEERMQLAVALVKSSHPDALNFLGQELTEQDKIAQQLQIRNKIDFKFRFQKQFMARRKTNAVLTNKKNLIDTVIGELIPILGGSWLKTNRNEWKFITPINDWYVETQLFISEKSILKLEYRHVILRSPTETEPPFARYMNFLSWLGIGLTKWFVIYESDAATAAKSLALLCHHFKQEMLKVLGDFSPDAKRQDSHG